MTKKKCVNIGRIMFFLNRVTRHIFLIQEKNKFIEKLYVNKNGKTIRKKYIYLHDFESFQMLLFIDLKSAWTLCIAKSIIRKFTFFFK